MKIRRFLKEDFDLDNFMKHIKHAFEFADEERCKEQVAALREAVDDFMIEYNKIADNLAMSKAGSAYSDDNIVGYLDQNGRAIKYNKLTNDFVVYNPDSPRYRTFTLHKKTPEQFEHVRERDFAKELPNNQTVK